MRKRRADTTFAHSIDRRVLLWAMVGAAVFMPHASDAQRAEQVGSVEDVKGEAFAEARSERRPLGREAPLFIKDLVGTGAELRFTLQLGKDTTLRTRTTGASHDRSFSGECGRRDHARRRSDSAGPAGREPFLAHANPKLVRFDCGAGNALLCRTERRRLRRVRRAWQCRRFRCGCAGSASEWPGHQHRASWRRAYSARALETRTRARRARKHGIKRIAVENVRALADAADSDCGHSGDHRTAVGRNAVAAKLARRASRNRVRSRAGGRSTPAARDRSRRCSCRRSRY